MNSGFGERPEKVEYSSITEHEQNTEHIMSTVKKTTIPIPIKNEWLYLLEELLSAKECRDLIDRHTPDLVSLEPNYNRSLRNNTRCMFDDQPLADLLCEVGIATKGEGVPEARESKPGRY